MMHATSGGADIWTWYVQVLKTCAGTHDIAFGISSCCRIWPTAMVLLVIFEPIEVAISKRYRYWQSIRGCSGGFPIAVSIPVCSSLISAMHVWLAHRASGPLLVAARCVVRVSGAGMLIEDAKEADNEAPAVEREQAAAHRAGCPHALALAMALESWSLSPCQSYEGGVFPPTGPCGAQAVRALSPTHALRVSACDIKH